MVFLSKYCIACRKEIPDTFAGNVLAIGLMTAKFNVKKQKHMAKANAGVFNCFCTDCANKMNELIKEQEAKGAKE